MITHGVYVTQSLPNNNQVTEEPVEEPEGAEKRMQEEQCSEASNHDGRRGVP